MKLSVRLNEAEIKKAIAYWLNNGTTVVANHTVIDTDICLDTDGAGQPFAEASWEEEEE